MKGQFILTKYRPISVTKFYIIIFKILSLSYIK